MSAGSHTVPIALPGSGGVVVCLTEGGGPIPWESATHTARLSDSFGGEQVPCVAGRFSIPEGGTFDLCVGAVHGFRQPPPESVFVPAGQWVTVTVPLLRAL